MQTVLVLGGTGIIGYDVALAFLNKGYKVYATTRSQAKADFLTKNEITPIICNLSDDVTIQPGKQSQQNWLTVANRANVIVEAVADYSDVTTATKILDLLKKLCLSRPDLMVIYTSGVWVYGDPKDDDEIIDETSPINPLPFVAPRKQIQSDYIQLGAAVIQPSMVYGRSGSLSADYFQQVLTGQVKLPGRENGWTPFVHAIDLGALYVLCATKHQLARGQIFIGSSFDEHRSDICKSAARACDIKLKSLEFIKPTNPFDECCALSQRCSSQKAKSLLGWTPTQPSIIDDAERFIRAYQLSKS